MYRIIMGALCAFQFCVLLPMNLYFGATGHPFSFLFAALNVGFGWFAGYCAANDPFAT